MPNPRRSSARRAKLSPTSTLALIADEPCRRPRRIRWQPSSRSAPAPLSPIHFGNPAPLSAGSAALRSPTSPGPLAAPPPFPDNSPGAAIGANLDAVSRTTFGAVSGVTSRATSGATSEATSGAKPEGLRFAVRAAHLFPPAPPGWTFARAYLPEASSPDTASPETTNAHHTANASATQRAELPEAACQRHAGEPFEPPLVAADSERSPATRCVTAADQPEPDRFLPYPLTGRNIYEDAALMLACYLDDLRSLAYYLKLIDRLRRREFCPHLPIPAALTALIDKAVDLGLQRRHLHKPGAVFVTWLKLFEAESQKRE